MTNVFIGGLAPHITKQNLAELFSYYGDVAETEIVRAKDTGQSLLYAFVVFHDHEAAQRAIEHQNGCEVEGKILTVAPGRFQWRSKRKPEDRPELAYCDVYLSGLVYSAAAEDLLEFFGPAAVNARIILDRQPSLPRGFAYVTMCSLEAAEQVIERLDGSEYQGRRLQVCLARRVAA